MHLATISVFALASLAVYSVGNGTFRGKHFLKACADLFLLAMLTVFWFGFFHVLNS